MSHNLGETSHPHEAPRHWVIQGIPSPITVSRVESKLFMDDVDPGCPFPAENTLFLSTHPDSTHPVRLSFDSTSPQAPLTLAVQSDTSFLRPTTPWFPTKPHGSCLHCSVPLYYSTYTLGFCASSEQSQYVTLF